MRPVEGIVGPGISPNDINLPMPDCIKIQFHRDSEEIKTFLDTIVKATNGNAARVLRAMLAATPGADQLSAEFAQRLGL